MWMGLNMWGSKIQSNRQCIREVRKRVQAEKMYINNQSVFKNQVPVDKKKEKKNVFPAHQK